MRKILWYAIILGLGGSTAAGETVDVKYRGPVSLDSFKCQDTSRSTLVNRVCYDAAEEYMIIKLQGVYYHYCAIDAGTVTALLTAESLGRYYRANILGGATNGRFDCRFHRVPTY